MKWQQHEYPNWKVQSCVTGETAVRGNRGGERSKSGLLDFMIVKGHNTQFFSPLVDLKCSQNVCDNTAVIIPQLPAYPMLVHRDPHHCPRLLVWKPGRLLLALPLTTTPFLSPCSAHCPLPPRWRSRPWPFLCHCHLSVLLPPAGTALLPTHLVLFWTLHIIGTCKCVLPPWADTKFFKNRDEILLIFAPLAILPYLALHLNMFGAQFKVELGRSELNWLDCLISLSQVWAHLWEFLVDLVMACCREGSIGSGVGRSRAWLQTIQPQLPQTSPPHRRTEGSQNSEPSGSFQHSNPALINCSALDHFEVAISPLLYEIKWIFHLKPRSHFAHILWWEANESPGRDFSVEEMWSFPLF